MSVAAWASCAQRPQRRRPAHARRTRAICAGARALLRQRPCAYIWEKRASSCSPCGAAREGGRAEGGRVQGGAHAMQRTRRRQPRGCGARRALRPRAAAAAHQLLHACDDPRRDTRAVAVVEQPPLELARATLPEVYQPHRPRQRARVRGVLLGVAAARRRGLVGIVARLPSVAAAAAATSAAAAAAAPGGRLAQEALRGGAGSVHARASGGRLRGGCRGPCTIARPLRRRRLPALPPAPLHSRAPRRAAPPAPPPRAARRPRCRRRCRRRRPSAPPTCTRSAPPPLRARRATAALGPRRARVPCRRPRRLPPPPPPRRPGARRIAA
jgi:hypothetical protein